MLSKNLKFMYFTLISRIEQSKLKIFIYKMSVKVKVVGNYLKKVGG